MTTLGGGSSAGGSPRGLHQSSTLSEQGHRRPLLTPGYATLHSPQKAHALVARQGEARGWRFTLDENNCFAWTVAPNNGDVDGLHEEPQKQQRTMYLSSSTPCVDLLDCVHDPSTTEGRIITTPITPDRLSLFVHALAAVTIHAMLNILKGVTKGRSTIVPLAEAEALVRNILQRPKGNTRQRPRDIMTKSSIIAVWWIKHQVVAQQFVAPGYAPWLAGWGLSYLQAGGKICKAALLKLEGEGHIHKATDGWYTLSQLDPKRSGAPFYYDRPARAPVETEDCSDTTGSPATWKTSPSEPGLGSPSLAPLAGSLFAPIPRQEDLLVEQVKVENGQGHGRDAEPPMSFDDILGGPEQTDLLVSIDWDALLGPTEPANLFALPPLDLNNTSDPNSLELLGLEPSTSTMSVFAASDEKKASAFLELNCAPPPSNDAATLAAWFQQACPEAAVQCAQQARMQLGLATCYL